LRKFLIEAHSAYSGTLVPHRAVQFPRRNPCRPLRDGNGCEFEGEDIVPVIAPIDGHDALLSVMRLEGTDDYTSRIRSYAFSPETVAEIADISGFRHGFGLYTFLDLPGR
jgi:hypothetical protein